MYEAVFWAVWLDLEKEVAKAKQRSEAVELGKHQLPLEGHALASLCFLRC